MERLVINSEFVTVGQILKMTNVIQSGGRAKWFLEENPVYVNGEREHRRGRKVYDGDLLMIPSIGRIKVIVETDGQQNEN